MPNEKTTPKTQSESPAPEPPEQSPSAGTTPPTVTDSADERQRNLDSIAERIKSFNGQVETSYLEIGKLLNEAKGKFGSHGSWLVWLCENTDIRVGTAQRLMRLARELSNASPVAHLRYTKANMLLSLSEAEREAITTNIHTIGGKPKSLEAMSKRELEKIIRDRKKAKSAKTTEGLKVTDPRKDFQKTYKSTRSSIDNMLLALSDSETDRDTLDERCRLLRDLCDDTLHRVEQMERGQSELAV